MKNQTLKKSLAGRRTSSVDSYENLHLVSDNRRGALPHVLLKSGKVAKNGADDLMSPTDTEKHDSDSLLTSPQAPARTQYRSALTARKATLKLSGSQTESKSSSRPTRSSSASRPSISASRNSRSSYSCPSSPLNSSPPSTRSSTPASHKTLSRSSAPPTSSVAKARSPQNARTLTSSSRPKIAENLAATSARSSSCLPAPLRMPVVPSGSSGGCVPLNGRKSVSAPRLRTTKQPIVSSESPPRTPTKLKATPAGRPVSTGRSRLEVTGTMKGSPGTTSTTKSPKKNTSSVVATERLAEPSGRTKGHIADRPDSDVSVIASKKPGKSSAAVEDSAGFGKKTSKNLPEMTIKRVDIRNGKGGTRPISSTKLYPHSVRSERALGSSGSESSNNDEQEQKKEKNLSRQLKKGDEEDDEKSLAKVGIADKHDSARYEDLLLTEDVNSTNWLLSFDDDPSDPALFFDPLPEPFDPL